ncbi:PH domain-containing protein [Mangrovimonas sp. TPBH4]|uniref:PH domain-containing protein n=1 Tax=Mangrovimonas sp. TPBH4 TaxID=1645914 RepID=UPI0006B60DBE|nr:PH domain-containing protein [Mangrovimonas sp. TPBH4]
MSSSNFSVPTRQSPKGIIVMFAFQLYALIRKTWVFLSIVIFSTLKKQDSGAAILKLFVFVGIVLLLLLIISVLKYRNFKFSILNDYFVLHQGILKKEETSISKSKIQNVYIKQNLIQQIIDVVSLSVESAGDKKTEIEIKALDKSSAETLKALLISGTRQISTENEEAQEVLSEFKNKRTFFRVSVKNLLLEGVSENHLKSMAFIFAFFLGLYGNFKDVLGDIDLEAYEESYYQFGESQMLQFLIFNVALAVFLLLVAFLFSLVKTVLINFDLKVTENDKGLEISKGLFNKVSLGLVTSRIQTITLSTNRFKRALGLHQMFFTQAMVNKKQLKNFSIIGLSKSESANLVEKFHSNILNGIERHKPAPYFKRVKTLQLLLFVLLANSIVLFQLSYLYLLWNIPLLIFIFLVVHQSYKKAYYSIDEKYLVIGSGGLIDINTDMAEIHKLQGVKLKQSIFQKHRGIASVKIYTASKALTIPFIKVNEAQHIVDFLLYKVESEDRHWM